MESGNLKGKIHLAAKLLQQAHHAVAFTGAGISTASGIPDFRSPDSGLWNDVDPFQVASIYGFHQNPAAFYDWIKHLAHLIVKARPNPAHYALANLEAQGKLAAVITQNMDMLHTLAGSKVIYELHGDLREATCIQCSASYPGEPILKQFLVDGAIPRCPTCTGILKPNIILFGEQLPADQIQAAQNAAYQCDLMLIVGSSLEVSPANELPVLAHQCGAKLIIINQEPTPANHLAEVVLLANAADILPEIVRCLETL